MMKVVYFAFSDTNILEIDWKLIVVKLIKAQPK